MESQNQNPLLTWTIVHTFIETAVANHVTPLECVDFKIYVDFKSVTESSALKTLRRRQGPDRQCGTERWERRAQRSHSTV